MTNETESKVKRAIMLNGRPYRVSLGVMTARAIRWGRLHLRGSGFVDVREKKGEFIPLEGLLR